jgi:hypothetical protein
MVMLHTRSHTRWVYNAFYVEVINVDDHSL